MKIAPIDIAHKTFSRKMMGFDADEVMDFLRSLADEMESLYKDRNQFKETMRDKEMELNEYKERDELLKHTITTATKMSEKIRTDAEREAKLIVNDADHKAEMIICDARDSLKKIYQEISDLKRVRMQFENNMKALVQSHLTMLEQAKTVMPDPEVKSDLVSLAKQESDEEAGKILSNVTKAVQQASQNHLDV